MLKITITDWMSKDVVTASADDLVFFAAEKMVQRDIGSVVVIDSDNKPIGMFTERDILKNIVALGLNAKDVKIKDLMSKNVISVGLSDDYIIASKLVSYINIRHLPVLDDDGRLAGIISVRDLIKLVS